MKYILFDKVNPHVPVDLDTGVDVYCEAMASTRYCNRDIDSPSMCY